MFGYISRHSARSSMVSANTWLGTVWGDLMDMRSKITRHTVFTLIPSDRSSDSRALPLPLKLTQKYFSNLHETRKSIKTKDAGFVCSTIFAIISFDRRRPDTGVSQWMRGFEADGHHINFHLFDFVCLLRLRPARSNRSECNRFDSPVIWSDFHLICFIVTEPHLAHTLPNVLEKSAAGVCNAQLNYLDRTFFLRELFIIAIWDGCIRAVAIVGMFAMNNLCEQHGQNPVGGRRECSVHLRISETVTGLAATAAIASN